MVLTDVRQGPGGCAGTLPRRARRGLGCERGSQAVEFLLVLPAVGLAVALVVIAGLVGMEMVLAQGIAREAARTAAVSGDAAAVEAARTAAGAHAVQVALRPPEPQRSPGGTVAASINLTSNVLARLGLRAEWQAVAAMRVEGP